MKNPLPDTISGQAMLLLVVGIAFTHLISNMFYATDKESALLSAGGEHTILWVATTGSLAQNLSAGDWERFADTARSDGQYITFTPKPVVPATKGQDWHERTLQRALEQHVPDERLADYRIAYSSGDAPSAAMTYWRDYLKANGKKVPAELILVSFRLNNDNWLNVASALQSPPPFISGSLVLSMAVMLIAVTLISMLIVRRMTAPLTEMSRAAERLGADVQGAPIPETGPLEVRKAAHAFNVMQNRIRRFVQDRTQMLGAIAHDLGTPITRLRLRVEFVKDAALRTKMLRDLDDMQQMVASTLSFIREDATSEPQTTVDLGSLLTRVCDDLADAGAHVVLDDVPRWVLVNCRPVALRRAFSNLIENAVKYGKTAHVSLQIGQDRLLVHIRDQGPGIPKDRREDVFQPFHRLEDSRNRETGGTGLGLSVARTIIRAHGGDILLDDCVEGGLCVSVKLPHSKQLQSQEAPHLQVPHTGPGDARSAGPKSAGETDTSQQARHSGGPAPAEAFQETRPADPIHGTPATGQA